MNFVFSSNTNTSSCEDFWDECDDSMFNEVYDMELIEKSNVVEDTQTNQNIENSTKRKYCATESIGLSQEVVTKHKSSMIKKLKTNSLFKF